jgi:threonyl-tRNA synthetase
VKDGKAWETSPFDIASGIAAGLAKSACVAKVTYDGKVDLGKIAEAISADDTEGGMVGQSAEGGAIFWDMTRPLVGDCKLEFFKFDSPEGKQTFWHSSAHILGGCLEQKYGCNLTIGPPLENGYYYDCYMGDKAIPESEFKDIDKKFQGLVKEKQEFQRLEMSKADLLEMFKHNPFKVAIISGKIPDGSYSTVYRNGPLIDLCMGPHLPNTGLVKSAQVMKNSSAYWLGDAENDSLQRIYGVSFPDKKQLKQHLKFLEEAKKRDHRAIGTQQVIPLSPCLYPVVC